MVEGVEDADNKIMACPIAWEKFGDRKKNGMHVHQGSAYRCIDKRKIRK